MIAGFKFPSGNFKSISISIIRTEKHILEIVTNFGILIIH